MTDSFNDLLIDYEVKISQDSHNKELLLRETFALWYILVEGVNCESFSENDIKAILMRNTNIYQDIYTVDPDFNFIIGWMLTIAFWYFEPLLKKELATQLLTKAYKSAPKNSLFKWAIRKELGLNVQEVDSLKADILLRYDQIYNHGSLIKEYFLDITASSTA